MNRPREMKLLEFVEASQLFEHARKLLLDDAETALKRRGRWHLALSGGNTPRPLYESLPEMDPARVELWWTDERCVPADDPASNYRMAHESWLRRWNPTEVHRIEGELPPSDGATRYAERLEIAPPLDLALLGLGDDAHTASLFPGAVDALDERSWALVAHAPSPPRERVSMGLRPLLAARHRLFLVVGAGKHQALRRVLAGESGLAATRLAANSSFLISPPLDAASK